ncbi:hypothetical protein Bbelb_189740 [Branchiostoma belcheri]|nr:hypothetical protein Bbelb_189740 [Branchiostoma belcheri]
MFGEILSYIYSGTLHVSLDRVQHLYQAADLLQLDYVRDTCSSYMAMNVERSTCVDLLDVKEETRVWEAVVRWVQHSREDSILPHLRFTLLTSDDTAAILEHPLVREDPGISDVIRNEVQMETSTQKTRVGMDTQEMALLFGSRVGRYISCGYPADLPPVVTMTVTSDNNIYILAGHSHAELSRSIPVCLQPCFAQDDNSYGELQNMSDDFGEALREENMQDAVGDYDLGDNLYTAAEKRGRRPGSVVILPDVMSSPHVLCPELQGVERPGLPLSFLPHLLQAVWKVHLVTTSSPAGEACRETQLCFLRMMTYEKRRCTCPYLGREIAVFIPGSGEGFGEGEGAVTICVLVAFVVLITHADIAQNRTNWRELTVVCSNAAAR